MKSRLVLMVLFCLVAPTVFAQTESALATEIDAKKTGSSKDILASLFRASVNSLLGDDRTYTLNSSFLGIYQLLNRDGKLNYAVERGLKQNSFNLSLAGNEEHDIAKIMGGFTIAVINRKDIKADSAKNEFAKLNRDAMIYAELLKEIKLFLLNNNSELSCSALAMQAVMDTWNDASRKHDFSTIHPEIRKTLLSKNFVNSLLLKNNGINSSELQQALTDVLAGKDILHQEYQRIAKIYAQKLLWTFAPSVTYDRVNKQGEYTLASNATFGIFKNTAKKPWEFEIKAQFKVANDSTLAQSDYNDKPLSVSIGLNKVLVQNKERESRLEFKLFTQYNRQFGKITALQREDIFTLNSTLRLYLYKSIWLPVTLKYDVDKGKILGLFTLTANISK